MMSASLPPNQAAERGVCVLTEAEDVESNQPQLQTQHSQPVQSQPFIFPIQTALLRANLRKSHHFQQLF